MLTLGQNALMDKQLTYSENGKVVNFLASTESKEIG